MSLPCHRGHGLGCVRVRAFYCMRIEQQKAQLRNRRDSHGFAHLYPVAYLASLCRGFFAFVGTQSR